MCAHRKVTTKRIRFEVHSILVDVNNRSMGTIKLEKKNIFVKKIAWKERASPGVYQL